MRSCKTPLPFTFHNTLLLLSHNVPQPPLQQQVGCTQFISTSLVSMFLPRLCHPSWHHVSLCTYFGAICGMYDFGKHNRYLRPDEAMLDLVWQMLVYTNKINSVTAMQFYPDLLFGSIFILKLLNRLIHVCNNSKSLEFKGGETVYIEYVSSYQIK